MFDTIISLKDPPGDSLADHNLVGRGEPAVSPEKPVLISARTTSSIIPIESMLPTANGSYPTADEFAEMERLFEAFNQDVSHDDLKQLCNAIQQSGSHD